MLTKEKLEEYKELKEFVEAEVISVLEQKTIIETGATYKGTIEEIEFYNGIIEIQTLVPTRCGCCNDDNEYYSFPERYLYEESWVEEVKELVELNKEKARLKKQEEERLKKEKQEQKEREEYEKLKRKFENS